MGENESLVLLCYVMFLGISVRIFSSVLLLMFVLVFWCWGTKNKHMNIQTFASITCMYEGINNK